MRVTNMVPQAQYAMQQSQQALSSALQQVSTGLRVNQLSDDPSASANMVTSLAASANVDQYTSNVGSVLSQMQSADSAISSVVTSLNSAITLGTAGANGTENNADRQAIATQIEGVLSSVVAQANTSFQGIYAFGGSASSAPPFVAASTTYTSARGSAVSPLTTTTALTAGSLTTVNDATTGQSMVFKAAAGDTVATLQTAITNAVAAGTLSAGTSAIINVAGQLMIGTSTNPAGVPVSSNDAALGPLANTTALTPGSLTTISDATTGQSIAFKALAGDTVATLQAAITKAVAAGTISAGTSATINATGQLAIGTGSRAAGIVVSSNDAVLGSMAATPGAQVANAYAYVGNSKANTVQVGDSMNVATTLPGDLIFTSGPNLIGSISGLITALRTGSTAEIGSATAAVSAGLNQVAQQRVPLDNTISQLNSQESYLGQETVTLTSQRNSLVGISLADAATNLSQAELTNSAVLAAAAKSLPQTLLDYLK